MVKKKEEDVGFVRQFNDLKKKHPDAMLLFPQRGLLWNVQGGCTEGIGDTGAEGV